MQDYDNEMVARTVLSKVLADQYDMITYIVDGQYSIFIGDESKIATKIISMNKFAPC